MEIRIERNQFVPRTGDGCRLAASGRNGDLKNARLFHALARIRTDTHTLKERKYNHLLGRANLGDYWMLTLLPPSLLLAKCANFQAADPRDKVCVMLGLADDGSRELFGRIMRARAQENCSQMQLAMF